MLTETGCDAVMIARGAVGHPDIFKNMKILAETGCWSTMDPEEKLKTALKHFDLSVKYNGEKNCLFGNEKTFMRIYKRDGRFGKCEKQNCSLSGS